MPKKIIYEDNPWPDVKDFDIKDFKVVKNFGKKDVEVTLDNSTYNFFAKQSKKQRTTPEKLMAKVIDEYAQRSTE